jgi:hypothetical protein
VLIEEGRIAEDALQGHVVVVEDEPQRIVFRDHRNGSVTVLRVIAVPVPDAAAVQRIHDRVEAGDRLEVNVPRR